MPRTRERDSMDRKLKQIKLRQETAKLAVLKSKMPRKIHYDPVVVAIDNEIADIQHFKYLAQKLSYRDDYAQQLEQKTGISYEAFKKLGAESFLKYLTP